MTSNHAKTTAPGELSAFDMLLRMTAKTSEMDKTIFDTFDLLFKSMLAKLAPKEIRIFFAASSNFGHRASTVNMMNRLISYIPADTDFTFRIINQVMDDKRDVQQRDFENVISKLIPFLTTEIVRNRTPYRLLDHPNITLQFNTFDDRLSKERIIPPLPGDCDLAFCGGYDHTKDLTEFLRVKWMLCLTPYQFTKAKSLNVIFERHEGSRFSLLGPKYDKDGIEIEEDSQGRPILGYYGKTFSQRGFYIPDPGINKTLWEKFIEENPIKSKVVTGIIDARDDGEIEVMPVYFSRGRAFAPDKVVFFNLLTGIYDYKDEMPDGWLKKCTVVVMFSLLEETEYTDIIRMAVRDSVDEKYPNLNKVFKRHYANKFYRIKWIEPNGTAEQLNKAIAEAGPHGVVVVKMGFLPNYISNYFFSTIADLPPVFEGEGSASLILNSGNPFLHLLSGDILDIDSDERQQAIETNQLYPTVPISERKSLYAQVCHEMSLSLVHSFEQWENIILNEQPTPAKIAAEYIIDAYTEDSGTNKYFQKIRKFYHNEQNDKLVMGLIYLLGEINSKGPRA